MKLTNRLGERYDRLLVIARAPNAGGTDTNARWVCRCDCGRKVIAYGQDLKRHKVKSCGCLNKERIKRHGHAKTLVYRVWQQMFQRCYNKNCKSYDNYGGRGITVDERWNEFSNFIADMGERPKNKTLERINNNGNYSRANCRWATYKEQLNNRRNNRMITAFGHTKTLTQWSNETGIPWYTLRGRIEKCGWSVEDALRKPIARQISTKTRKLMILLERCLVVLKKDKKHSGLANEIRLELKS